MFQECKMISKYLHTLAYILHTSLRCRAVKLDVCGGFYTIGT